jgi:hypothetical protein
MQYDGGSPSWRYRQAVEVIKAAAKHDGVTAEAFARKAAAEATAEMRDEAARKVYAKESS